MTDPTGGELYQRALMDLLPRLERALLDLEATRLESEHARSRHDRARDDVHDLLRLAGSEMAAGGDRLPAPLVERLYWGFPEVHAAMIGTAIGVAANRVHSLAGRARQRSCRYCGRVVDAILTSRTDQLAADRRVIACEVCAARTREEREESWQRQRVQYEADRVSRRARLAEGGYWINELGEAVDSPDRVGFDRCNKAGFDNCFEYLSDPMAWKNGGAVTWFCERCGSSTADVLVLWIPPVDS